MEKELTLYQLGNLLKAVTENYEVSLMSKIKLSGGWMTITGNIDVDYIPTNEVLGKGSNIIGLKINNNGSCANDIKITGMKDLNFKVNLAATKFKEIHKGGKSPGEGNLAGCEVKAKMVAERNYGGWWGPAAAGRLPC